MPTLNALSARLYNLGATDAQVAAVLAGLSGLSDAGSVGGHENMTISLDALAAALGVSTNDVVAGLTEGWFGQTTGFFGGNRGNFWSLFNSLHSEFDTGDPSGQTITFHIDTFNAFSLFPLGTILHGVYDVALGTLTQQGPTPGSLDQP